MFKLIKFSYISRKYRSGQFRTTKHFFKSIFVVCVKKIKRKKIFGKVGFNIKKKKSEK